MPLDPRDRTLLMDMHAAASHAMDFVKGMDLSAFVADLRTRRAVEREIEIIGEAARSVSDGLKTLTTHIPWRPIIAQRHILAHEYGEIQEELIWRVVTVHLPSLAQMLDELLEDANKP